MDTRFQWLAPAIPEDEHSLVELLVIEALRVADFIEQERRAIVVRFVPDTPPGSQLVATIEEARSGKLLGVLDSPRGAPSVKLTPADQAWMTPPEFIVP